MLQAALGNIQVNYDNVKLVAQDGTTTGTAPPTAVTLDATNLSATNATLNASVNPNGSDTIIIYEYGLTTAYGSNTPVVDIGSGTTNVTPLATPISGLTPCTTYHFRIDADNMNGPAFGNDATFKTDCPPSATTLPASNIGAASATLNGSVNPNGPQTQFFYEYGTTTAYGQTTSVRDVGSGRNAIQPLSVAVANLAPNTTYHFQVVAVNPLGTTRGGDQSFTTGSGSGTDAADRDDRPTGEHRDAERRDLGHGQPARR